MNSLTAKIHRVRSEGLTVAKTGKISGGINALFASYPDVWAALFPVLKAEGLSVGFSSAALAVHEGTEIVSMLLTVSDGESSEQFGFSMMVPEKILNSRGSSVTNNAQRVANAQSYLKRTALIHFFGMSAGNEDEVERMMPRGDQTNIPGAVVLKDGTAWQSLTDGMWAAVISPADDGLLGDYGRRGAAAMVALWSEFPDHAGICAWAADWIESKMEDGISWAEILAIDPALPATLGACNAGQLRAACKAVKAAAVKGGAA